MLETLSEKFLSISNFDSHIQNATRQDNEGERERERERERGGYSG